MFPPEYVSKVFTKVIPLSNLLDAEIKKKKKKIIIIIIIINGYSSFRHLVESLTNPLISLFLPIYAYFRVLIPYFDPRGSGADREGYVQLESYEEGSGTIIHRG